MRIVHMKLMFICNSEYKSYQYVLQCIQKRETAMHTLNVVYNSPLKTNFIVYSKVVVLRLGNCTLG